MQLIHGGDVYSFKMKYAGIVPLDFSANINPFGMPESVRCAMYKAVDACQQYPDPICRALRHAIGEAEEIPPEWIYCGNGAADVLFRLSAVLRSHKVLLTAPTFAEYEQSLPNCTIHFHTLSRQHNFVVTKEILKDITDDLDAVYLCNPNNPTGQQIEPELLLEILNRCDKKGIYFILDECFYDFLPNAEKITLKRYLSSHTNLILLRAFTKMYAVPGVRLGYCMSSNNNVIDALYQAGQPWNVSVIAQKCGIAAVHETRFVADTVQKIKTEREFLQTGLARCGMKVYNGSANFILFHSEDDKLHEKLEAYGILIRNCDNYRGLSAGDYRIAVRTHVENTRLLNSLDDMIKG